MKFLKLKTENQLPLSPSLIKRGSEGALRVEGVSGFLKTALLMFFAIFTAALPAWATAKAADVDNASGLRFDGGVDVQRYMPAIDSRMPDGGNCY